MKQVIKDRIKELDIKINQNKSMVKQIDDLPLSVRMRPDELRRKRILNDSINSLVSIRRRNDDILHGRLSDV